MSLFLLAILTVQAGGSEVTAAERAAIFKAAGHVPTAGRYLMCDRETPLELETRDINGDGRLEAVVIDGGTECYRNTGAGFTLLTRTAAGRWAVMYESMGIPTFLPSKVGGWPEIEVGGPGFCFPILRWTGKQFVIARHAYEGKACRP